MSRVDREEVLGTIRQRMEERFGEGNEQFVFAAVGAGGQDVYAD